MPNGEDSFKEFGGQEDTGGDPFAEFGGESLKKKKVHLLGTLQATLPGLTLFDRLLLSFYFQIRFCVSDNIPAPIYFLLWVYANLDSKG